VHVEQCSRAGDPPSRGSDAGGHRAATIYTLIQTARLNDVDPQAWLADVLARRRIIRPSGSTNSCPGIGAKKTPCWRHEEYGRPRFVTMLDADPAIWRRIEIPADFTLKNLHDIIQAAMGWYDYHLHHFEIGGSLYGEPAPEDDDYDREILNERKIKLGMLGGDGERAFDYVNDYGDNWRCTLAGASFRRAWALSRLSASLIQSLDKSSNVVFSCWVLAASTYSAQRIPCKGHWFGSPSMTAPPRHLWRLGVLALPETTTAGPARVWGWNSRGHCGS
jgi:hypothetical protein